LSAGCSAMRVDDEKTSMRIMIEAKIFAGIGFSSGR
jgi:hypothetical protein